MFNLLLALWEGDGNSTSEVVSLGSVETSGRTGESFTLEMDPSYTSEVKVCPQSVPQVTTRVPTRSLPEFLDP